MLNYEILEKLTRTIGVSGEEDDVRSVILSEIEPYADEIHISPLGNILAFKKGEKRPEKKLMLCAHMDEVGFVITNITENGLLKFTTVGNIRPEVLSGRDVLVGGKTPGVICAKPVHLLKGDEFEKPVPVNELAIDIGADTREQAETLVQIGDNACFVPFFEHVHGTVKAKALDDRVGCFALITLMQRPLEYDTYFVFSTQEEIGLRGAGTALLLALVGTFFGCLIGFAVGALQTIPIDKQRDPVWKRVLLKILHIFLRCYVELFRGTPMIVQAVFIYYGLLQVFGIKMGMWQAGFFIVSINTGAYMAETVRGGIVSIDPGQTEGAKAIGMNHWQTMLHVILPQALRNIIPQIGNNFIINIKDTSVLSVISITDLFFVHKSVVGALYTYFESAAIVMVIYLTMTLFASYLLRLWEKALDGPQNYDLNTTDSLAYTSGMYNAPDPNHESQNLDMKGGAAHV